MDFEHTHHVSDMSVAILTSRYNHVIVTAMLESASALLQKNGIQDIEVFTVPGALELPLGVACLQEDFDGILALGCVIRGATYHFDLVAAQTIRQLTSLSAEGILLTHSILVVDSEAEAKQRLNQALMAAQALIDLFNIVSKKGCEDVH